MRRPSPPLLFMVVLGGTMAALAAPPPAPRAVARADASLVAFAEADSLLVQNGARRAAADAPAAARADSIARLAGGWLLAGSAPSSDGGRDIWLRRGDGERVVALPPPTGRSAALRHGPVLLGDGESLSGLAWLEGSDRRRFEVRFAPWEGAEFGTASRVAPRGRGSQLALAGARLADGRMLLVWAGFDGTDDEIWAAIGTTQGGWTTPVRVGGDNDVPDIKPDIVASGSGAWIAWSRFDGEEYQAVIAQFDGSHFSVARPVAESGSLYPTFEREGDRWGLLFLDARRQQWALRELDAAGHPRRLSRLPFGERDERPRVVLSERGVAWAQSQLSEATAWE